MWGCTGAGKAVKGGEGRSKGCSAFSLMCLSFSFSLVFTGFYLTAVAFAGFVGVYGPGFSDQKELILAGICITLARRSGHKSAGICKNLPVMPFLCHFLICSLNTHIYLFIW